MPEDTNETNKPSLTMAENLRDYNSLAQQCRSEYTMSWKHQKPKKDEWEVRLKLYNNQKRDASAVGDTTLFTIQQTVLASLYVDRLSAEFDGREEGDQETADNLTALAEFDYDEMGKAMIDYDWNWDACFFGRAILAMEEYHRDPENNVFVPMPQVIDPVVWLRDPRATSINGDKAGRGAMRFGGYEMKMGKQDILDNPHMMHDQIRFDEMSYGGGTESLLRDVQEARDLAQGRQTPLKHEGESQLGENAEYDVTVWYTHTKMEGDAEPQKYKVFLVNERSIVIGFQKIERKVGDRIIFPLIDRPLYPTAHDWDGTSIPDLVEDKQRARAVAQNLGLKAMKADLYPMYVYDSNKITNKNDLNFDYNKFIPADLPEGGAVSNAIAPILKARPNMNLLDFIYTSLDASAQKATATPEIQQGALTSEERTLGELNLIASNVDTRYSLAAKVFGWSEKDFWRQWYALYDENFADDIDEKILRVVGAYGAKWRPLGRDDIIAKIAPDIRVESRILSRAQQLEERTSLANYFSLAFQDPTANRRYGLKELGRLSGLGKDQLDRLLPPTVDERIAEDQNELLNQNKLVPVLPEDDHNVHLEIHAMAKETDAAMAHIETHKKALSIKKVRPDLFPVDQTAADFQEGRENNVPEPQSSLVAPRPIQPSQTAGRLGAQGGGTI